MFVSNIGSEHFIGLSGSGAAGGIGVGAWEFNVSDEKRDKERMREREGAAGLHIAIMCDVAK